MLPLAPEHDIDGRRTRILPLDHKLGRPYKPRPTWDNLLLQPPSSSCGEQSTKATGCETLGLQIAYLVRSGDLLRLTPPERLRSP